MAKVRKNFLIRGLDGVLGGQFLVRTGKISGRTNVFAKTDCVTRHDVSPAQGAHKQAFHEASAYADANRENPIYIAKAKGKKDKKRQPYNVAIADWFHPPQVLEIDLKGWRGAIGEVIRVLAADDVRVAQVRIEISEETGAIVEAGEATKNYTQWWEYAVQGAMRGECTVTVLASDLPGHVTQASASKRLPD